MSQYIGQADSVWRDFDLFIFCCLPCISSYFFQKVEIHTRSVIRKKHCLSNYLFSFCVLFSDCKLSSSRWRFGLPFKIGEIWHKFRNYICKFLSSAVDIIFKRKIPFFFLFSNSLCLSLLSYILFITKRSCWSSLWIVISITLSQVFNFFLMYCYWPNQVT